MSTNTATAMDVDAPSGTLKRCSSAPMINENGAAMTTSPSPSTTSREQSAFNIFGPSEQTRTRRYSTSFSPLLGSPNTVRLTPRISQLRQEECPDLSNMRELAHEREIHHTIQISQSWEDLRLVSEANEAKKMSPLHVTLPPYSFTNYNSPSPTRMTSVGFPSPTRASRTFVRRSASPVLRPSSLGAKRKLDEDKTEYRLSPCAKRFQSSGYGERGLLTTSSPVPGSLSSVGTPESLSSADSPSFSFRMIDSPSPNRVQASAEPMVVSKSDQEMSESLS